MPDLMEELSKPDTGKIRRSRTPRVNSRAIVLLVALLVVAAAGYAMYTHFQDRVSSDDANVDGHISTIAPKVGGNVVEVLVRDNQAVKAGDVLVRIDPRDFQARVDMAKAAVLQAESQFSSAQVVVPWTSATTESGISAASAQLANTQAEVARAQAAYAQSSGADLAVAEANIRAQQANSDRAQADLERMKPLADKAEISKLQFDAYAAAAKVAESELQAATQKLASVRAEASVRQASLDAAQSRVRQAQAQVESNTANRRQVAIRSADAGGASAGVAAAKASLEAAELQLSYTTITAPIDGVVTRKSVEVGQMLAPGQGLMTIIPLTDVWVTANFKETQLADVRPGQRAEIKVDMYGRSIGGHVDSIAGATGSRLSLLPPENATGNFVKVVQRIPVKILVDKVQDNGLVLRPGMNVDVTIFTR